MPYAPRWERRDSVTVGKMRVWLLVAGVGCGGSLPSTPAAERVADLVPQVAASPAHAAFSIVPADLGDDAALARIRHRVRVRWLARASPTHGAPMDVVIAHPQPEETDAIMPVIGESATEIRVVVEDDHARLALWIDRLATFDVAAES